MLDKKGFDLWANDYDKSVKISEDSNSYPFAGYKDVLNTIYNEVRASNNAKVLDMGFGTGVLTSKLYDDGYTIYGIDFSDKMIDIAKSKMPNSKLFAWDFQNGLPDELKDEKFDFIICTYAIHHLSDEKKISFIKELLDKNLNLDGKILIGDVAFATDKELSECKSENENNWDHDEIYPTLEVFKNKISAVEFIKISFCSGVLVFQNK